MHSEIIILYRKRDRFMKRIYISILVLIAVFAFASAELGYVSAKADGFISMIEQTDKLMLKSNSTDDLDL